MKSPSPESGFVEGPGCRGVSTGRRVLFSSGKPLKVVTETHRRMDRGAGSQLLEAGGQPQREKGERLPGP